MEIHMMANNTTTDQSAKKDIVVRNDSNALGEQLYDLLDGNEGDLQTYLSTRLMSLRGNYDHLTKRTNILPDTPPAQQTPEQTETLKTEKENTIYSLRGLEQMLENMRVKEGTSWDDDEAEFT
jgi:hypothetical protein